MPPKFLGPSQGAAICTRRTNQIRPQPDTPIQPPRQPHLTSVKSAVRTLTLTALALLTISTVRGQNVQTAPLDSDRAYVPNLGWSQAADQIGEALRRAYRPGRGGTTSSVANRPFRSWLLIQEWSALLARDESAELARFIRQHLFGSRPGSEQKLTFVGPGIAPPDDLPRLDDAALAAIVANPDLLGTLTKDLLPARYTAHPGPLADALDPAFLAAMVADEDFLRAFFTTLSDHDFTPLVLANLESIWQAHQADWKAYRHLAIAIAVVLDASPPANWPHHQVDPAEVPIEIPAPAEWFAYWVDANSGSKLYNDLRQLEPEQLKFIIDAPLAPSEFDWAQSNARFPRTDFGRAFSSIEYDHPRLVSRQYDWPAGPYTLANIATKGGICVDQAYFAMIAGKARGLPTLYFVGQGTDGGHAWFGYMKGADRWDLDCGRYQNQGYAVGTALDPQSWRPINDHALESLAKNFRRTPDYLASQADLAVAALFEEDPAAALAALDSAIGTSPENDNAWDAKTAHLLRTDAPATTQIAHHEAALAQFANDDDLKAGHQLALAQLARASGDEATAQNYEDRLISQNRRDRSDLSITVAAKRLTTLVEKGKPEEALTEYRTALRRLGKAGGGSFFYEIVRPLAVALAKQDNKKAAQSVVAEAKSTLNPEPNSILEKDVETLTEKIAD